MSLLAKTDPRILLYKHRTEVIVADFGAFSFDVTKRILDVLKREGPLKRTNLATKAGLNYNVCTRYLTLLSAINWVEVSPDVSITETGRLISDVLIDFRSMKEKRSNQIKASDLGIRRDLRTAETGQPKPARSQKSYRLASPENLNFSPRNNGSVPKVMIVDDEQDVALTFQSFLSGVCNASIFNDPYDALRKFASNPREIDLVVLDIRMPEMNGLQLYRSLAAINKDCKFLFVSALDAAGELLSIFPEIRPSDIIRKPVDREAFRRAVSGSLLRS